MSDLGGLSPSLEEVEEGVYTWQLGKNLQRADLWDQGAIHA